ncbi:hypothetical protein [Roseomonas sp. WA12]
MSSVTQPTPPLTLPPQGGGKRETFWSLVGVVVCAALLGAMMIFMVPGIATDWQVKDTAQPVADGRVTKGRCSTRLVITTCDATLSLLSKSGPITREVDMLFLGVGGDYTVSVLADPARPELVTTNLGLDRLWNRTLTALVAAGLLLIGVVTPIIGLLRRRRGDVVEG